MNNRRKWLIRLAVVAALLAGGGYAYLHYWRTQSPSDEIVLYGNVDIREADLAFNVAGRIETMLVEEGDEVRKGELLATLEPALYQGEVDAADAQVAAQKAVLDRLLAGSRQDEIKRARDNVRALEAQLELAQAMLKRTRQLVTDSYAPMQKLDEDQARVSNLEAQLKASGAELSLAIEGPRAEDITAARAQLRAREAEKALAQQRLDYTKLFAKEDGVIRTRIAEPGAVVMSNSPVYTLALRDPVWVRTYISETDLGRIRPGMKAQVLTDSEPGKVHEGWVGFISPVAEFTPKTVETPELRTSLVYQLRVYVKDPDDSLRQGMPVTIRLETRQAQQKQQDDAAGNAGSGAGQ